MSKVFLNKIIKEYKPNISTSSLVQYTNTLNKLLPNVNNNEDLETALSKEKVKALIDEIENKYTSASSRGFKYNSLIAVVKKLFGENDERYILLSKKRDDCNTRYSKNLEKEPTEEFKTNMVHTEEYEKMLSDWKPEITQLLQKQDISKNDFMDIQSYYLALIYLYFGLRNDVSPMIVIFTKALPTDESKNYLHVYNRKYSFVLNQYKTAKTYGKKVLPISDKELVKGLSEYITFLVKYNNRKEGLRLFSNKSNSDYIDENNLSTMYSNIFKVRLGKRFNTTTNRKRIVSESDDVKEYMKAKEKVELLASKMMNSVGVQQAVYNKNE